MAQRGGGAGPGGRLPGEAACYTAGPVAAFVLPFEKPVAELVEQVRELRARARADVRFEPELTRLEEKASRLARELFAELTPMQKVQLSRHANRPYTLDYVKRLLTDWVELHGDRRFGDDPSIVAGLGRYRGRSVIVVGHQKGRGTKENMKRNFGMPHPEGYRKAVRMYEMADRFRLPILTFIDTPGAYPGIGAEERGQSEAIGASLAAMARVAVPIVATVIGEGGSGGALALGVANRVLVLEFGCYSVISPEGCAAILWKDGSRAEEAATRLKITAPDLLQLGVVDAIVDEPPGGAHQDHDGAARFLDAALGSALAELEAMSPEALVDDRYHRFRDLGAFVS
jgi:acetyl-CoA carboxylase carboxyl transferase subunit alpha